MRCTVLVVACGWMLITAPAFAQRVPKSPDDLRYNEHIRPLLSENCFACHGPDSASRKAELRLDRREDAIANGAIVPGDVDESELIARIRSTDPEVMMPPPKTRKRLKPADKQRLAQWIAAGAKYQKHWSFIAPSKAPLPQPEGVKQWARNPIDHFVFQRLKAMGLKPNGEASPHELSRRVALDATGLPPDSELQEPFVSRPSEESYRRYVDSLLKSKHAGEHRGRFWLDAARYGDTHGMHVDNYREIWPYRDWVVQAFNNNMPFDRFVIEQIAGDMLPSPTIEQRVATGFNRCNITTSEGGAIPAELHVRYMVDRVETTATVFLGLTAGCAVCHDHKFDPLSQREFYQLGAFFNNTTTPAMDGNQKDTPPVVALPAEKHEKEWNALQADRRRLRRELGAWKSSAEEWWKSRDKTLEHPVAADELAIWMPLTAGEGDPVELPKTARWASGHPAGKRGVRFEKGGDFTADLPGMRSDKPFTVSFWYRTPDRLASTTLFEQLAKKDKKNVGWKITSGSQGALTFELFDAEGKSIRGPLPDNQALRPRKWQHVCVRYSGGQSNSSIIISADGVAANLRKSSEQLIDATALADVPVKIARSVPTGGMSDIRVYRRWLNDDEVRLLAEDHVIKKLVGSDANWERLSDADRRRLTRYHDQSIDEERRQRSRALEATVVRHDFIYSRSTTTLVMQERPTPPRAFVLERGQYEKPLDEVSPGVPAVLPPLPKGAPRNRLGLASWLVHPDHPLTARVTVNRMWQSVFGVGLVKTSEDFGATGDQPSHPELLDWLAVEFVESGWDVRRLMNLILTSSTYRQSSRATAEKLAADPDNRFFSRGPRIRLDAEMLRDQALDVSGLLCRDLGGPSVRPYQPAGLWTVVAITGSNTRVFKRDSGDALYRRSMYTFWKRTSPPPSMAAFNAPTREQCTVRRERTNTPLQALIMLNDPQYVEAARRLAELTMRREGDDKTRAAWMLERTFARPGDKLDVEQTRAALADFLAVFEKQPEEARKLIKTGESKPDEKLDPSRLAAWTLVASMLMNRDDFLNK